MPGWSLRFNILPGKGLALRAAAWGLWVLVLLLPAMSGAGAAEVAVQDADTAETAVAPTRDYGLENRALGFRRDKAEAAVKPEDKPEDERLRPGREGNWFGVVFFLVMVLGAFLVLGLYVFKRILPNGRGLFSSPALEVLGRTHFDQQKYVALLRVGKRLLVVGVAPGGFDALTEIADEVEVADLMAVAKPKTSAGKNIFHRMFLSQLRQSERAKVFSGADAEAGDEDNGADNVSALSDIQARVRSLRETE